VGGEEERSCDWDNLVSVLSITALMNEDLNPHPIPSIHILLDLLYQVHELLLLIKLKKFYT